MTLLKDEAILAFKAGVVEVLLFTEDEVDEEELLVEEADSGELNMTLLFVLGFVLVVEVVLKPGGGTIDCFESVCF